eukprot:TRINITY_DN70904_c0_g1_i8.p2 TRINITY_DN70904_c0_g1~~TRINITY_DN70904_c0_g1_i8.p2  ORF type:complete len:168 (+),score=10.91 TRINITY_DN70904_c0_g1_i8:251-754(+)
MAFDVYMQCEGIPGEALDEKHKDWIKLLAFSHNVSQPQREGRDQGAVGATGRVQHGDFITTKHMDKASPKFNIHCCKNQTIPKITIELCQAGGDQQTYMKYVMENVQITSIAPGGSYNSGDIPTETLSFNYDKITWTYTQLDPDTNQPKGNTESHWDLRTNTGGQSR